MSELEGGLPAAAAAGPRGLSRNVYVLGAVSLFADISSEMVYPIIPLFLRGTLGAPVIAVGVIEGVAESAASLLKLLAGWTSDRIGRRRPFALAGYGLAAVAKPLLALAAGWPFVLFVRLIDRAGKGVRTAPRDALIADSSSPATHGRAFGIHRSMDTTGAIAGPLLALLLLAWAGDGSYRLIFLVAAVPGAISVALMLGVREVRRHAPAGVHAPLLSVRGYDRRFLVFTGAMLLFSAGNSSDAFLVLRSRDLGLGASAVVFAYVLYNASYAALSLPAGIYSDRIGRMPVLVAGLLIFAGVYAGFALASDARAVWPLFIVYGAYIALTEGVARAYVADLVPPERRGAAMGLYNGGIGVMLLVSSVVGGALWDLIGPSATFAFGASTAAAAALALVTVPGAGRSPSAAASRRPRGSVDDVRRDDR